jgi:hypothetical protein
MLQSRIPYRCQLPLPASNESVLIYSEIQAHVVLFLFCSQVICSHVPSPCRKQEREQNIPCQCHMLMCIWPHFTQLFVLYHQHASTIFALISIPCAFSFGFLLEILLNASMLWPMYVFAERVCARTEGIKEIQRRYTRFLLGSAQHGIMHDFHMLAGRTRNKK